MPVPNILSPRLRARVSSRPSLTTSPESGVIRSKTANPTASSDQRATLKSRWYDEKCLSAVEPAATIIRVTARRLAKTQPVKTVVKLTKEGAVTVDESPCNNATNPGTHSIVSFLAQGVWSWKPRHLEGGSRYFGRPILRVVKSAKVELRTLNKTRLRHAVCANDFR